MAVAVLGDNAQAWLLAAHASAASGEPARLVEAGFPTERRSVALRYQDGERAATIDLAPELHDEDTCVIVAASELHRQRAALTASLRRLPGRIVVLVPGGAGGALTAAALFAAESLPVPLLAEVTGFPVLGSIAGRVADIPVIKRGLPIGVLDAGSTVAVTEAVRLYLPDVVPASGVLATSLANTNNVVHPPLAVANAARIESGLPFRFYREGLTPAGARLMEAVDVERLAVTDALGLERVSITDWFRRFYGDQGMAGDDIGAMLGTFGPFAESPGPSHLRYRYLIDDVGSGLAVIEAIALRIGVPSPVISALCSIVSTLAGEDLRAGAAPTA